MMDNTATCTAVVLVVAIPATIAVANALAVGQSADVNAGDVRVTLERWERCGPDCAEEAVLRWAESVRGADPAEREVAVPYLLRIMTGVSQTELSRSRALQTACAIAQPQDAELVARTIQRLAFSETLVHGESLPAGEISHKTRFLLRNIFIQERAAELLDDLEDHERIFNMVASYIRAADRPLGADWYGARLMAQCDVPRSRKQEAVLAVLEVEGKTGGALGAPLLSFLDSSAIPKLRELVRAESSPRKFNFAAADALSQLADTEIIPDLEKLRSGFRSNNEKLEGYIDGYIWRINVQHPPTKLLDYIATTDYVGNRDYRYWAVHQAFKHGIEPEKIRQAILAHAKAASAGSIRGEQASLKQAGLELGILKETDLPDVKLYDSIITP